MCEGKPQKDIQTKSEKALNPFHSVLWQFTSLTLILARPHSHGFERPCVQLWLDALRGLDLNDGGV